MAQPGEANGEMSISFSGLPNWDSFIYEVEEIVFLVCLKHIFTLAAHSHTLISFDYVWNMYIFRIFSSQKFLAHQQKICPLCPLSFFYILEVCPYRSKNPGCATGYMWLELINSNYWATDFNFLRWLIEASFIPVALICVLTNFSLNLLEFCTVYHEIYVPLMIVKIPMFILLRYAEISPDCSLNRLQILLFETYCYRFRKWNILEIDDVGIRHTVSSFNIKHFSVLFFKRMQKK